MPILHHFRAISRTTLLLLLLCINSVCQSQIINTIAGTGTPGYYGDGGAAIVANLNQPWGIKSDGSGNIFFADYSNSRVRMINSLGIITTVAGNGTPGFSGDGVSATATELNMPIGVALDAAGNIYIGDNNNNRIRKINTSGIITTIAGTGTPGYGGDGGPATLAMINRPAGISLDAAGNLYIADYSNHRIRQVDPTGVITTIAGTGIIGATGDGGPAIAARLDDPYGVYADVSGDIYIADGHNNRVRKITSGIITTFAGGGSSGLGDGGPATAAQINVAIDVASDASGNIYISDGNNSRIRKVDPAGIITTFAGTGIAGFSGDGGPATIANINHPGGVAVDGSGNIYIGDWGNNRIREISVTPIVGPITGPDSVCIGATISLSDATPGGTWSSSNTAIATVGSGTGIVTGVSAGNDIISYAVTNLYGTTTVTKTITVLAIPNAGTITGPSNVCVGSAIILSDAATGGVWSSSNTGVATVAGGVVTGLATGSATISYTVTNMCGTAIATHTVLVAKPSGAGGITGPPDVCVGASITLSDIVTGGVWSSSSTIVAVSGRVVTGITPGMCTISYTVTNTCGDVAATTVITVIPLPDAGVITGPSGVCAGASINLSDIVTGGVWSSSNSNVAVSGSVVVTGITPGKSTISYIVTNVCGSDTATKTITVMQLPDAGVITGPQGVCTGASITLSDAVSGGVWSSSNTIVAVSGSSVTGITAGTCTISYTVTNSCGSNTATKAIMVNPLPDAGTITGLSGVCKGAAFKLSETVPGGKWSSTKSAVASIDSISGMIIAMSVGTTMITYTVAPNTYGCINSTTFPLTVSKLFITGNISQVTCYGSNDGNIAINTSGGTGPYQYTWSKGETSSVINNLPSGSYTLQVKDISTQCVATDSFIITQPDSLLVTSLARNDTCKAGNGSISVSVTGGTVPYQYLWSNNATANSITGLFDGAYTIVVTDKNNCKKSLSVIVEEDTCLTVIIHDVITPDGDGINDVWVIEGMHDYPKNTVHIFDKWGNVLYEKDGYNNDWAGRGSKGELLPDGTYFYLVKLNTTIGKNVFTGAVLIKR